MSRGVEATAPAYSDQAAATHEGGAIEPALSLSQGVVAVFIGPDSQYYIPIGQPHENGGKTEIATRRVGETGTATVSGNPHLAQFEWFGGGVEEGDYNQIQGDDGRVAAVLREIREEMEQLLVNAGIHQLVSDHLQAIARENRLIAEKTFELDELLVRQEKNGQERGLFQITAFFLELNTEEIQALTGLGLLMELNRAIAENPDGFRPYQQVLLYYLGLTQPEDLNS